jgi:hypothetical protein
MQVVGREKLTLINKTVDASHDVFALIIIFLELALSFTCHSCLICDAEQSIGCLAEDRALVMNLCRSLVKKEGVCCVSQLRGTAQMSHLLSVLEKWLIGMRVP